MKEHVKDSQEEFFLAWWPKGGIIDRLIIEIYCNRKMSDKILRITMARKVGNVRAKEGNMNLNIKAEEGDNIEKEVEGE